MWDERHKQDSILRASNDAAHLAEFCHDCGLSSIEGLQVGGDIGDPLVVECRQLIIQLLQQHNG